MTDTQREFLQTVLEMLQKYSDARYLSSVSYSKAELADRLGWCADIIEDIMNN